jgi:hypothetical protein
MFRRCGADDPAGTAGKLVEQALKRLLGRIWPFLDELDDGESGCHVRGWNRHHRRFHLAFDGSLSPAVSHSRIVALTMRTQHVP